MSDSYETANGFDPKDSSAAATDSDRDGITNADEVAMGTDPNSSDSDRDGQNDGSEQNSSSNPNETESKNDSNDSSNEIIVDNNTTVNSDQDNTSKTEGASDGSSNNETSYKKSITSKDDDENVSLTFNSGDTVYNFTTNNFNVDYNDSTLNKLYNELSNSPIKLKIIGHTDSTGDLDLMIIYLLKEQNLSTFF